MKIGIETLVWGPRIEDLKYTLDAIVAAGYQGVEISQRRERLGLGDRANEANIENLLQLLRDRNLVLIGLAGGTLLERIDFCGDFRPEYLCVYGWHKHARAAVDNGFTLGLHPHLSHPKHRIDDALELLNKHPELKFVPDTALLSIAGDDAFLAIHKGLGLGKDRLVSVHLKDWSPEYGRSSHRYARGFTELGQGDIKLMRVVNELQRVNYKGWMVVEQDNTRKDPVTCAFECAEWLAGKDLLPNPKKIPKGRDAQYIHVSQSPTQSRAHSSSNDPCRAEHDFLEAMLRASSQELSRCYQSIATAFGELIDCHLVTVWMCDPMSDVMTLMARHPLEVAVEKGLTKFSTALSRISLERQATTRFDLWEPEPGRRYGFPELRFSAPEIIESLRIKQMISVPILSAFNPHHSRLLVNLFPRQENPMIGDERLFELGEHVAMAADSALDEFCSFAAAGASICAGRSNHTSEFLQEILDHISEFLGCKWISIFLVNDIGSKLEVGETTGLMWTVPEEEHFYTKDEGLTGRVWRRKEVLLSTEPEKLPDHAGKSFEHIKEKSKSYLCAPLVDSKGEVVAVVRCHNKQPTPPNFHSMFTNDDVAVLDAIGQAAVPHLQVLMSKERRAKALKRFTHELRTPVSTIRNVAHEIEEVFKEHKIDATAFLSEDYLGDIKSWCDLMKRLVENVDLFRLASGPGNLNLQPERTLLMKEVVAPSVRHARMLLRRKFPRARTLPRIHHGRFDQVPALYVDKNQFQQVMFNLLSNAIKYAWEDPNAFSVEINGEKDKGRFVITVRDWGTGVDEGLEQAIFNEGVRAPSAVRRDVVGDGIGLWVVRRIIEAHGGRISLTHRGYPTEFSIVLPTSLASRPAKRAST